ncbi:MAG TPA: hypothetical protein VHN77_15060 [Phycisphaerales bacterium]|nr:hypothetical protein [Phycisphaerales bacterium]
MAMSQREIDRLTSDIMSSVQGCMAGLDIIASRDNAARLSTLRSQVREQLTSTRRAPVQVQARVPSWMLVGFALSLMGGLMGFVGAAKSYEVAGTQRETVDRFDRLVDTGALERVERASAQIGDADLAERINKIEAFQLRATQAVRDLAGLHETPARLRQFQ